MAREPRPRPVGGTPLRRPALPGSAREHRFRGAVHLGPRSSPASHQLRDRGRGFMDLGLHVCEVGVMRAPSSGFLGQLRSERSCGAALRGLRPLFRGLPQPQQRVCGQDGHFWQLLPPQSSQIRGLPGTVVLIPSPGGGIFPWTHPGPAVRRAHQEEGPRPGHTPGSSQDLRAEAPAQGTPRQKEAGEPSP